MMFVEGMKAIYDGHLGIIKFVGNSYITLCIKTFPKEKVRDVCILIYKKDFSKICILYSTKDTL